MGNAKRHLTIRIGLFDNDLSKLNFHLYYPIDYVEAVLTVTEFVLNNYNHKPKAHSKHVGEIVVTFQKDEVSRVIIRHGTHKIVSFHYPFDIDLDNGLSISYNNFEIGNYQVIKILDIVTYIKRKPKLKYGEIPRCNLYDAIRDLGNEDDDPMPQEVFALYEHVISSEPGYLRYDYDTIGNRNKLEYMHPLNHIDINYHSHSTYKYGLYKPLDIDEFEKTFIKREEKLYLVKYDKQKFETIQKLISKSSRSSTNKKHKSKRKH